MKSDFPAYSLELIAKHEGFSASPYRDSKGHLTILWGHNLDAAPLIPEARSALDKGNPPLAGVLQLQNDARQALDYVSSLGLWSSLSTPRQCVLLDMCYNMGAPVFSTFHTFLSYVRNEEWALARDDMLQTKWASEVKARATEDAQIILSGVLPLPNTMPTLPHTPVSS